MELYRQPLAEVFSALDSSAGGLDAATAEERLQQFGFNQLETKTSINPWQIFIDQFKSFIIYILLFAVVFSLLIGEYVDSVIILIILLVNAAIGFYQELSAHESLEALKKISTLQATVLRSGQRKVVDAKLLVPGDVVLLEAGDRVPADLRIIESVELRVEESALTGESVPVEKQAMNIDNEVPLGDRRNMLYSATTLSTGNCRALVAATGMVTELGKIAELVKTAAEEQTPLQRRLDQFGKKLSFAIIIICLLVFALFFFKDFFNNGFSGDALLALVLIAISLAVAAVPTALPAVVTIALSVGVKRLLDKKALVRNLSSVETLGSCDVICTDKTGTLTASQMTVRYAWTADGETVLSGTGYSPEGELSGEPATELFRCGLLCNNASLQLEAGKWHITGDPTEAALLTSAAKAGVSDGRKRLAELPFSSERKLMTVLVGDKAEATSYSKGALTQLLRRCNRILLANDVQPLTDEWRERIEQQNADYASQALRVLAFAMKPQTGQASEQGLVFVGLQAMIDPPRPDVLESLLKTRQAGIRVIMITGDYGETAKAIGREIGIEGGAMSGEELTALDASGLKAALENGVNIFSRVAPEHKQRIVEALQQMGKTVAMTGDGVNDAPALKKANIGVAVGSGTEVAKEASDLVLLDDSFTHIVNAIEEGRGIYDNIQKSIMLLLSGNLGEVLIIFCAALFGINLPLTAVLLLWINMVTDGAPALAYSVDPYGTDIMLRRPKPREEGILPTSKLALLGVLGTVGSLLALTLFFQFGGNSPDADRLIYAQTMVFNFVVLYEVILTFVIRSSYQVPFFANRWVWAAALLSIALQALLMYTPLASVFKIVPLGWTDILALACAGALFAAASLIYQLVMRWQGDPDKIYS
ncbi:Ca2+-transporting ATPase [Malonomonas rubra DSM 5091]|uniref:Ca2+-transporting ATPase n=1 Tax=Malonomonas rubra DSM 5091 TaxID=1122189 RepID=A0A1M6DZW6_MALRU|nr:cation-translocating P-type ATPase [Malonomonas rubra]SHI78802.1 Ca2+-transporting ATPase [Malonomonas rubra DSM 5091]